jgi:8-oxo-dGTP diphosphatase
MQVVHVAVGVILDAEKNILLTRRHDHLHQGGLWEFPGGKVEQGESLDAALARELHEELAIKPVKTSPLIEIHHDYPDKSVFLDVHVVWEFRGEAQGVEGQPMAWVSAAELSDYDFPEANKPIVAAIVLELT